MLRGLSPRTMAIEDGAVARLLPADCLSIQEVGATGMLPPRVPLALLPRVCHAASLPRLH